MVSALSLVVFAMTGVFTDEADATEPPQRRSVPFKVLYNHDGTYMKTCVHPWRQPGEPFSEAVLIKSVEELAGKGIDAVAFNPGNGSIPWWQSRVYPDHWQWYTQRTGKKPSEYGRYVMAGGDMVKVFVETCRRLGLRPFITLRLKDEHNITQMDNEWVSKFFYEHQRWRLNPSPDAPFGVRGLNWIFSQVRQERLGIIQELCENYDLDGLELDFMRFPPYFDLETTGYAQRRDVMTDFIHRTRKILDRTAGPGQRRVLSIRVPNRLQEYRGLGIDLAFLDQKGWVDLINVSPSYVSQVDSDFDLLRAWAPQTAMFYEMTHCAARGTDPTWGRPVGHGDGYPVRFTTRQKYVTMANLAFARGADGVSLFNFIYSRPGNRGQLHGGTYHPGDPPFGVIDHFHDRKWLARQAQHYWIPHWWKTGYHGRQFQLPKTFVVGTEHKLQIDLAFPDVGVKQATLRIQHSGDALGLQWAAWLNGSALPSRDDVTEPFADPYGGFQGRPEDYAAWDCPVKLLQDGLNHLKVKLLQGPISEQFATDVIYVDLAVHVDG